MSQFDGTTPFVIWSELDGIDYALKNDGSTAVINPSMIDHLGQEYLWTVTYGWEQTRNVDYRYYIRPVTNPQSTLTLYSWSGNLVTNDNCGIRFYSRNDDNSLFYLEGWGWARLNLGYHSHQFESNANNYYSWARRTRSR